METACERLVQYRRDTWVHSQRHSLEWHYFEYVPRLQQEIAAGRLRRA
jgi:hypothetical protein